MEVLPAPGGIILRRKWFSRWVFIPMFFAVGLDVYAVFFYRLIVGFGPIPAVAMFFPLANLVLAVVCSYAVLAAVWNRTEITVSTQGVKVEVGPLPWPGNKMIPVAQIRTVRFVSRYVGKGGSIHRLLYLDTRGRERPLLRRVITREWAEYVAAIIGQRLHLPPPVD